MKNIKNKAFTLVELLVVITILAIISVVAYQNFGWAVGKAVSGRKISDVYTIETSLQQYKADNNYYPATNIVSATNMWGYNPSNWANKSNTIKVTYTTWWNAIDTIVSWSTAGWGKVTASWTTMNIWFKGTISQATLGKKYLTKDLYDPELWDIKVWTDKKMIDSWVGRYVYAIYKKWWDNTKWDDYNIAYTIKKDWSDTYLTKIWWTYDEQSCYWTPNDCPKTLIWSASWSVLIDWDTQKFNWWWSIDTSISDQWIPYPVTDFTRD